MSLAPEPNDLRVRLSALVLGVHHRNGGSLETLDLSCRLLAPELRLDSLDLAELMVAIEREFGVTPFDAPTPPRTWEDVLAVLQGGRAGG